MTTKTRSPEYAAAFAVSYAANQALSFAEMDREAAEFAYLNNANRYSHGQRKTQALKRALESAEATVKAARVVADAALATLRAVKDAEAKAAE